MTVDRDFKRLVRARAARTGESYQAALRTLLARPKEDHVPYSAAAIAQPTTLADIRTNPTRYIVDTGAAGVTHLCLEVIANAIDEAVAGHATAIEITIDGDGFTVSDDGRGIPPDAAALVVTVPGTSAKRTGDHYRLAGGFNGLGLPVVAALSRRLELTVDRAGSRHAMVFESTDAAPAAVAVPLHRVGPSPRPSGTTITARPDPAVFAAAVADGEWLARRVGDLAALHPSVRFTLGGRDLSAPSGLADLLPASDRGRARRGVATTDAGSATVVVAPASGAPVRRGFVNDLETVDGDHLDVAAAALPAGTWHVVVSVRIPSPAFEAVARGHGAFGRQLGLLARAAASDAVASPEVQPPPS